MSIQSLWKKIASSLFQRRTSWARFYFTFALAAIVTGCSCLASQQVSQTIFAAIERTLRFSGQAFSKRCGWTASHSRGAIAESYAGRIRVLRTSAGGDKVSHNEIFASGLKLPFGIAFYPGGNDPYGSTCRTIFSLIEMLVCSANVRFRSWPRMANNGEM